MKLSAFLTLIGLLISGNAQAGLSHLHCPKGQNLQKLTERKMISADELTDLHDVYDSFFSNMDMPNEIELILTPDEEHESVGALFCEGLQTSSRLTLLVTKRVSEDEISLRAAILHETLHYLVFKRQLQLPPWAEEGLAFYFQSVVFPHTIENAVQTHLQNSPWVALGLTSQQLSTLSPMERLSFYGEAYLFIQYLVTNFDEDILTLFFRVPTEPILKSIARYAENSRGIQLSPKDLWREFVVAKTVNSYDYFGGSTRPYRYMVSDSIAVPKKVKVWDKMSRSLSGFLVADAKTIGSSEKRNVVYVVISPVGEIKVSETRPRLQAHDRMLKFAVEY